MSEEVLVGVPVDQARQRLLAQVRRDGLHSAVAGSFTDGERIVSGAAVAACDRSLSVRTLPSYLRGAVTIIPLRWYRVSAFDVRFPVVDANLEMQQRDSGTSRLGLTGIFRPSTGQSFTSGEQDEARATIRRFLGRLATICTIV